MRAATRVQHRNCCLGAREERSARPPRRSRDDPTERHHDRAHADRRAATKPALDCLRRRWRCGPRRARLQPPGCRRQNAAPSARESASCVLENTILNVDVPCHHWTHNYRIRRLIASQKCAFCRYAETAFPSPSFDGNGMVCQVWPSRPISSSPHSGPHVPAA